MNDAEREVIDGLASEDPGERVLMLQVLSEDPTGAPAVLERVRELLADDTPVILSLPHEYGEVRHMAARALAAEHRAAGIGDRVVLADVPAPIGVDDLIAVRDRAGLRRAEPLAAYAELRERGLLPVTTVELDPAKWPQAPSTVRAAASDGVVAETLEHLSAADVSTVSGTLQHLRRYPTGSPDVAAAVRAMLADPTPTGVDVPFVYGELRWAAAHALAAEHRLAGVPEPVVLADVPRPLSDDEMSPLARSAGLGDLDGPAMYAALRERRLVPLTTVTLTGRAADGAADGAPVEAVGRALELADRARATMFAEFGVRYIAEVAMQARLRRIERRGTFPDGLRYDIHGRGYTVTAPDGGSLTLQGRGIPRADRPVEPGDGVYDYVDLYALRSYLRGRAEADGGTGVEADVDADLDALAAACAEHVRRGVLRDAGDLTYELLTPVR